MLENEQRRQTDHNKVHGKAQEKLPHSHALSVRQGSSSNRQKNIPALHSFKGSPRVHTAQLAETAHPLIFRPNPKSELEIQVQQRREAASRIGEALQQLERRKKAVEERSAQEQDRIDRTLRELDQKRKKRT